MEESINLALKVADHLENRGLTVYLESELAEQTGKETDSMELDEMQTDFIIVIGGDGTILRTCLLLPKPEPPILAVNMGVRGFLADIMPENVKETLNRVLEGKFVVDKHWKLSSFLGKKRLPDALNEVFVSAGTPAKLFHAQIWKNGVRIAECRADGLMVATQVGSTGYSLSAGGPVLDPELEAFVLTPVCPLTVSHPVVFSAKTNLTIEILKPEKALIVIDGHFQEPIEAGTRLIVGRSENETSFIRFKENFYQRLESRLFFARGGKS
jgi:NAD+ kinase